MMRFLTLGLAGAALLSAGIFIGLQYPSGDAGPGTAATAIGLQPQYRSGPFHVGVEVVPTSPDVGENRLRVLLRTPLGEPARGATIRAVAEMPAMGTMPAMRAPAEMTEVEPGLYEGTFDLSMEGSWPLTLAINDAEMGETRITLDMATGRPGLELSSGATPLQSSAGSGVVASTDETLPYRSGPYRLDVQVQPPTPRMGGNTLTIRLHNENGEAIPGASIRAVAEMPAMGTMPAMRAPAEMTEVESGLYEGEFNLSMEGSWPLSLAIQAPGLDERRVSFDLATGREGLQLASGGSRAGADTMEEAPPGTVTLDPARRQLIGVKTAEAQARDLTRTIRAVGRVTYDETRLADVALKVDVWIGELYVDYVGAPVEKGQKLFTVYGPELLAAQQEYLELGDRRSPRQATNPLLAAARKRLALWDMSPGEIEALRRRGAPVDYVAMYAPMGGTVVSKNIVEGTAKKAGVTLMRIADLSRVWVEADVYESELSLVQPGMPVTVSLPYLPGRTFAGMVDYLYPYLDGQSRTGRIRVVLDNPDGMLKPQMYAQVRLEARLGPRLTVPEEAVIIAGETRVVFEDLGGGRLAPRIVETGQRAEGRIEILSGLEAGDRVVTSGNFLIASESRLKAGIKQW
ncbi:MAG: efflux RND transporter periplasmic adaptor subunit [Gammaproteobacteria bacterium]|nr:efflux RND transporter periplasmic adaptor subunit [Gammaproteobacteria bacterium]